MSEERAGDVGEVGVEGVFGFECWMGGERGVRRFRGGRRRGGDCGGGGRGGLV